MKKIVCGLLFTQNLERRKLNKLVGCTLLFLLISLMFLVYLPEVQAAADTTGDKPFQGVGFNVENKGPCDWNEYFWSVDYTTGVEWIEVAMDVDTEYIGSLYVNVEAYLIDPYSTIVDSDFPSWPITMTEIEYGYAYLYVPAGSQIGWYDVELWLYDECWNYEDYWYTSDVLYYEGPCSFDEFFWSVDYTTGAGWVVAEMDVDTTYSGSLSVYVDACLIDPFSDIVDIDSVVWDITMTEIEYGYAYLYVPAGSQIGWYDVELYLYDECMNHEDFWYTSHALYYEGPCSFDEFFWSVDYTTGADWVLAEMDVDTTYSGSLDVSVDAYLFDPYGIVVDLVLGLGWSITAGHTEYGYAFLTVPADSPSGWYDVELYLRDECLNYEDYRYDNDILYYEAPPSIVIYTDKYTYHAGDTMHLGLDITNPESAKSVCIAVWLERPVGGIKVILHAHSVTLPAGLAYSNPNFKVFTLPSIPAGIYTWNAALLDPTTHTVIDVNTAQWEFS